VHEESFRKAMKAGVKIVFGTDIFRGTSHRLEFPQMTKLGMTPADALAAPPPAPPARHDRPDRRARALEPTLT
jgi:hypothetical protein